MTPQAPLLELTGIRKNFGNTAALRGVDFRVAAGEVHALLGQNGSGKSTLMKIAYGEIAPTGGQVRVNGAARVFASPHAANQAGIAAVAQEVPVVASLSVAENVLLGRLPRRLGRIRWRAARQQAGDVLDSLGGNLDLDMPVADLGPEERQVVAIARALAVDARILIFDEPTSSLSAAHAASLFRMINDLKARGLGMVFISQRLQDVAEVADRVTVMRDGVVAGTLSKQEATSDAITQLMIGRSLTDYFHKGEARAGEPALEAAGLSVPGAFENVTFSVRSVRSLASPVLSDAAGWNCSVPSTARARGRTVSCGSWAARTGRRDPIPRSGWVWRWSPATARKKGWYSRTACTRT